MKSTITLLPAEGTAYRGNGSDNVDAALLTASIACKALVPCQEISLGQINLVDILKVGSQSVTYKHDGFIACQRRQAPKELHWPLTAMKSLRQVNRDHVLVASVSRPGAYVCIENIVCIEAYEVDPDPFAMHIPRRSKLVQAQLVGLYVLKK